MVINRQQKFAEWNNYKPTNALFHYDYKIEREVQYETLAIERMKNEQALKEGEDDSYLAWNVGSEKSHFHLLSKFSILVCICGILLIYYYSVRLIEKEKTDVSI